MGQRAQALAERFEQMNREMIAAVEGCPDAKWSAKTSEEEWSVGVVAHHVAESHKGIAGLVQLLATGQPLPGVTMDMIHQGNAVHAQKNANCTKAETLDLMRANAAAAASLVRGLGDEGLDRTAAVFSGGPAMSAEQLIERILIGHVQGHLASIRTTAGVK